MSGGSDYLGILGQVMAGKWRSAGSDEPLRVPIELLAIESSLIGREAALVAQVHGTQPAAVIADKTTWEILGKRVYDALGAQARESFILERPQADMETVEWLSSAAQSPVLIAVGSGTVTDLVKHAAHISGREFSAFATSPMNAYTTRSASITVDGTKASLPSAAAKGVFFELETAAKCPQRLMGNALADVVCRSSAQIDWMLARDFTGSPYSDAPYELLAHDELDLMADAANLRSGDHASIARLIRTCVANGLGSMVMNSTHCGSMAEHSISHFLDSNCPQHPGSLHGEQVGVATLTVMALQERILHASAPPQLAPTADHAAKLIECYGTEKGSLYADVCRAKAISQQQADEWNERWSSGWSSYADSFRKAMLPGATVRKALQDAGAATQASELGFDPAFYRQAVRDARHLRERFTILDIADDAGLLAGFADELEA